MAARARLRGDARSQHHRRQRQDLRRPRRVRAPSSRERRPTGTSKTPPISGSACPTTLPEGDRARARDRRFHRASWSRRGFAYAVGRRRLLPRRAAFPPTARLSRPAARPDVEDSEPNALKDDPRDFALWKATKPGEDTSWDSPWGARPARLAHRVLGDGRADARAPPSRSTAAVSTSFSPTTRTSSPSRARSGIPSPQIWAHNGLLELTGEKMSKSDGQHRDAARRARPLGARDAARLLPRRPLAQADRLLRRDDGAGRSAGRGAAGGVPRSRPQPAPAQAWERLRRRARRRLQHAGGARRPPRLA